MPNDDLDDHSFFADPPDDADGCREAAEDAIAAWRWLAGVTALAGLIVALCALLIVAVPAHADDTGASCAAGRSGLPWWLIVAVVAAAALGVVAAFACIAGTATRRMEDRDQ